MSSNAIEQSAQARVIGYSLGFKDFSPTSGPLPQRISIFTPIQESKQAGFTDFNKRHTVNSVSDALEKFGVCPAFYAMRILKPVNGGGVGSIPVDIFPVLETAGAKSTGTITVTGTATKTVNHTIVFNGRDSLDGQSAVYQVELGDTETEVAGKISAAISNFLNCPLDVDSQLSGVVTLTSKWQTSTANEISYIIDTANDSAGLTYSFVQPVGGLGTIDISTALDNIGEVWTTTVLNCFDTSLFDSFADFNGIPDPDTGGTGRWNAKKAKPFICVTGSVECNITTLLALTASRKDDLTNCLAVAPNSPGYTFESAANMYSKFVTIMNSKPHTTAADKYFPDMPAPIDKNIGDMKDYNYRDQLVKGGVSTVTFDESQGYRIEDFVTFRRLDNQSTFAKDFKYCRDIVGIDFNVIYQYRIIEERELYGKTIANDSDIIDSSVNGDVVKPKNWKGTLTQFFESLASLALIADPGFSQNSLIVGVSQINPKRFETSFNYKRTSTVRISSTTAYAGFNFG